MGNLPLSLGRVSLKFVNVISWGIRAEVLFVGTLIFGPVQALVIRWSYLWGLNFRKFIFF